MNVTKSQWLLFAVLAVSIQVFSNTALGQDNNGRSISDLLGGTWDLDYDKSISTMKPSSKTYFDNMDRARLNDIQDGFKGYRITFNRNGEYAVFVNGSKKVTGTWELSADDETLTIHLDGGMEVEQKIISVDNRILILDLGESKTQQRLFEKWYLNKAGQ